MKRDLWIITTLLILAIIFAGCAPQNGVTTPTVTGTTSAPPQSSTPGSIADIEATLEFIYPQTNPSVVNIEVVLASSPSNPDGGALASGFVWDTQGNLVTNNHVVDGATGITVTFYDGTTVPA